MISKRDSIGYGAQNCSPSLKIKERKGQKSRSLCSVPGDIHLTFRKDNAQTKRKKNQILHRSPACLQAVADLFFPLGEQLCRVPLRKNWCWSLISDLINTKVTSPCIFCRPHWTIDCLRFERRSYNKTLSYISWWQKRERPQDVELLLNRKDFIRTSHSKQ